MNDTSTYPGPGLDIEAGSSTPWGMADYAKNINAESSIVWVETPSHGGYYVDPRRVRAFWPEELADYPPFAGAGWYEEDQDWIVPVLAEPQFFNDHQRHTAYLCAQAWAKRGPTLNMNPASAARHYAISQWLKTDDAEAYRASLPD